MIPQAKDGNCLFRSLAYLLYGDVSLHPQVRRDIVEHMKRFPERYQIVAATADSDGRSLEGGFQAYLQKMSQDRSWGGYPEVMAAEELADRPVVIYSSGDFHAHGGVRKMQRLDQPEDLLPDVDPLQLAYYGGRHYNAVVLADASPSAVLGKRGSEELVRIREERFRASGPSFPEEAARHDLEAHRMADARRRQATAMGSPLSRVASPTRTPGVAAAGPGGARGEEAWIPPTPPPISPPAPITTPQRSVGSKADSPSTPLSPAAQAAARRSMSRRSRGSGTPVLERRVSAQSVPEDTARAVWAAAMGEHGRNGTAGEEGRRGTG